MILNKLSPDDVIMAVLSLCASSRRVESSSSSPDLDIINLFLMILRLLNNASVSRPVPTALTPAVRTGDDHTADREFLQSTHASACLLCTHTCIGPYCPIARLPRSQRHRGVRLAFAFRCSSRSETRSKLAARFLASTDASLHRPRRRSKADAKGVMVRPLLTHFGDATRETCADA